MISVKKILLTKEIPPLTSKIVIPLAEITFIAIGSISHFLSKGIEENRSGPRILDSAVSEISAFHYAAVSTVVCPQYTASGVCRFSV
jgi:hypothetical protein